MRHRSARARRRRSVSATESLGSVVLLATAAGILRVRAEVPRRGRFLDDDELADELERELRGHIAEATDAVLETAEQVRAARAA